MTGSGTSVNRADRAVGVGGINSGAERIVARGIFITCYIA
jgi:hypothetical protein